MNHDTITDLPLDECWELLRAHAVGRLAFHLADQVRIVPMNYVVDKDTLLFRTAEGSKLLGVGSVGDVAFEIDGENGDIAWSVVLHGTAQRLDKQAAHRADDLALRPWVRVDKDTVVEIIPTAITGRRFRLDPQARYSWLGG
jgi:nitroimidazol reductase NimA-like FMN-containing flavoprotein (pyridoxamine 5'-phosphate oxidase superfamily)